MQWKISTNYTNAITTKWESKQISKIKISIIPKKGYLEGYKFICLVGQLHWTRTLLLQFNYFITCHKTCRQQTEIQGISTLYPWNQLFVSIKLLIKMEHSKLLVKLSISNTEVKARFHSCEPHVTEKSEKQHRSPW